jgi:actin-related protein
VLNDSGIKAIAPGERQLLPWIGAATVSGINTFGSMWITKHDYDENGPSIVHRKVL